MKRKEKILEERVWRKYNLIASQIRERHISKQIQIQKNAYLTIDDGPTKDSRLKFDVLQKKGIPAVWFCIGNEIEKYKDIVISMIRDGAIIANHSYSHIDFSVNTLHKCFYEIEETDRLIDECYYQAGINRGKKFFRFPFGHRGYLKRINNFDITPNEKKHADAIQAFLGKLDYECPNIEGVKYKAYKEIINTNCHDVYWTYDVMEWVLSNKNNSIGINNINDVLRLMDIDMPDKWLGLNSQESEEIILIHDHCETTEYFEMIINHLLEKKLNFCLL